MFNIEVTGLKELEKRLDGLAKKQLPFAIAKALTKTGQIIKKEVINEMKRVFNRPTPYTLNSLKLTPATKRTLVAEVWFKDPGDKAITAGAKHYLTPQVYGGNRQMKRSEKFLGSYYVPGGAIKLNKYGNVTSGQITKILSGLKLFSEKGFSMNRTTKEGKYFTIKGKSSHLAPGVWERKRKGVSPVLIFTNNPNYTKRLAFFEIAQRTYKQNWKSIFEEALQQAIATSGFKGK